jgi:hypothetical protein
MFDRIARSGVKGPPEGFADCKRIACPWQGRLEQGTLLAYWIVTSRLWRIGFIVIPANVASTFSRTPFCFPLIAFR